MKIIAQAAQAQSEGARVLGIHLEGPVISPINGPRGAHPLKHCRSAFSRREFDQIQEASYGQVALVTLAPESTEGSTWVSMLVEKGVTVGIGHTDANRDTIHHAARRGAKLAIHLGNAVGKRYGRVGGLIEKTI